MGSLIIFLIQFTLANYILTLIEFANEPGQNHQLQLA
jgi:hypothetical protein